MSAEAERAETLEAKKAENGDPERSSGISFVKKNWSLGLKIFELILTIFCIGLAVDPLNYARLPQNNIHHVAVIYTAFSGYIIINSVLVLGGLAGERMGWKTSVLFSLIGVIVFTAAGGVIIYDWSKYMYNHIFHPSKQYMDMLCSSGVFAIFNAFTFLVDAILTYREEP